MSLYTKSFWYTEMKDSRSVSIIPDIIELSYILPTTFYTKSYWETIFKNLSELIPNAIVLSYISPMIYINIERLKFETVIYIMSNVRCSKKSKKLYIKYDYPLILLKNLILRKDLLLKIDKIILSMGYKQLIIIKQSLRPIILANYFNWKNKGFPSNTQVLRKGSVSKEDLKNNTSKLLWGYEEIKDLKLKDLKLKDNVILLFPCKENDYLTAKGYISFDDQEFEEDRRYIGLSNCKHKIEVFDTRLYQNGEFKIFVENNFTDMISVKRDILVSYCNMGKNYNIILPWNLLRDDIFIITHGPIDKRNMETFRFVKTVIKNNFINIIVINKKCDEKIINLQLFEKPILYKCKPNIISLHLGALIKVYPCFQPNGNRFYVSLTYKIIFKNDKLIPIIIPKLITSTLLGGLGTELLIIDNDNITILIPAFDHFHGLYKEFLLEIPERIKYIIPDNTIVELFNISDSELLLKIT
jgi:hypothetical protein